MKEEKDYDRTDELLKDYGADPEEEIFDSDEDTDEDFEDPDEEFETQESENYLDSEEEEKRKQQASGTTSSTIGYGYTPYNNFNNNNMQTNPFGQPQTTYGGYQPTSPWGTPGQTQGSIWGSRPAYTQPTYAQPNYTPSFASPWSNPAQPVGGVSAGVTTGRQQINRNKKIVFCDFLDNLVEPYQTGGKLGVQPRGIYDLRLKFEVWDKLACFGAEYIFVLTNQSVEGGSAQGQAFMAMANYVTFSLAEYLRMPYENVRCFVKTGYNQTNNYVKPGTGLIHLALENGIGPDWKNRYQKSDMIVLGAQSGYAGQGNRDAKMAENFKIDYTDIGQLLSMYY
jgi:hypothetical protein